MSSKRKGSLSVTPDNKKRRHCSGDPYSSDGASTTKNSRKSKHSEGGSKGNPDSQASRNSPRSLTIDRPDYAKLNMEKDFTRSEDFNTMVRVEPFEFVCLFDMNGSPEIPLYIKHGKRDSTVMKVNQVSFRPKADLIRASYSNEQKKRLDCLENCIQVFMDGYKHQLGSKVWVDTNTVDIGDRIEKCFAIVQKKYGFDAEKFLIVQNLNSIYTALEAGLHNGIARNAMYSIFALSHLLLDGCLKHMDLIMNIGGGSTKNDVNSHLVKMRVDVDQYDERNEEEIIKDLMSAVEIENGIKQQAIPDVALFVFDKENNKRVSKWYLFGECKTTASLFSEKLRGQVLRQCLRGHLDFDTVYGCGISAEGSILSKNQILNDNELNIGSSEFSFYCEPDILSKVNSFYFNCKALLD